MYFSRLAHCITFPNHERFVVVRRSLFIYAVIGCIFLFLFAMLAVAFLSLFCLVLVSPGQDAKDWDIEVLTVIHNGDNDAELARVHKNHPGEPECIVDRRVLGALAPTRCESSCLFYFIFGSVYIDSIPLSFFPHTFFYFVIPRPVRHDMFRLRRHPLQAISSFYSANSV